MFDTINRKDRCGQLHSNWLLAMPKVVTLVRKSDYCGLHIVGDKRKLGIGRCKDIFVVFGIDLYFHFAALLYHIYRLFLMNKRLYKNNFSLNAQIVVFFVVYLFFMGGVCAVGAEDDLVAVVIETLYCCAVIDKDKRDLSVFDYGL